MGGMHVNMRIALLALFSITSVSTFENKAEENLICKLKNCYLISDQKRTWYQAYNFCKDNSGVLTSIIDDIENKLILNHINDEETYWIGLNSLNQDGIYIWLDNTSRSFVKWKKEWDNISATDKEKCIYIDGIDGGTWKDAHCEEYKKFICKKTDKVLPPFPPVPNGNCPDDWYQFESYCYKLFDTPLSWNDAKRTCRSIENVGNGDLASIHNFLQQNLLTSLLQNDTWIGGTSGKNDNQKIWSDNSQFDYDLSLPNINLKNFCLQMKTDNSKPGRWEAVNCTEEKPYICQTYLNNLIDHPPTIAPEKCERNDYNLRGYRDNCYYFHEEAMSWIEGEKFCEKFGGHLAIITDAYESSFINFYLGLTENDVWLGLKENEGLYKWLDTWPLNFTNWMKDQPINSNENKCGLIDIKSHKWKVAGCQEKKSVMCKLSDVDPEVIQEIETVCPNHARSWNQLNNTCYKIMNKALNWFSATEECSKQKSKLISFHSRRDLQTIISKLKNLNGVWIGLNRFEDESYKWQDGSAVDFVNWKDSPIGDGNCVEMSLPDMFWKNSDCNNEKPFICGVEKILSTEENNKINKKNNPGLSSGSIAAICIIIIIFVLIVINFILWRKGLLQKIIRR